MKKNWKETLKLWLGALLLLAELAAIGCKKLSKKVTAVCIAAALIVAMVPVAVFAAETTYDIWVGGVQVKSANKDDITTAITEAGGTADGTATYDPESETLTLNNFSYTGQGYEYDSLWCAAIFAKNDLTVKVVGSNTVTASVTGSYTAEALNVWGALTITGDSGSSLTLIGAGRDGVGCGGNLKIENVTVNATGTSCLYSDEGITIHNAIVNAVGNGDNAIYSTKAVSITNSSVTATAPSGDGIFIYNSYQNLTINNSMLTASVKSNGINVSMGSVHVTNSFIDITTTDGFAIESRSGGGQKAISPYFTDGSDNYVVYAGDDAGSATEAYASADATYANKYVKIEPVCTVAVNYGVDGVDNKEITVTKGDTISLENPVIDGYLFMGWFTDTTYQTAFDFTNPITANTTIYAKFADYEGDKTELNNKIDAAKSDLQAKIDAVNSALAGKADAATVAQAITDLNTAKTNIQTLLEQIDDYVDADTALKTELITKIETADNLIHTAISDLTSRVETLESELAAAKSDISTNASKVAQLTADLATLNASLTNLSNNLTNDYATKAELTNAINSAKDTINSTIDALTIRVQNLEAGLAEANGKININTTDVGTLKTDVSTLKTWQTEAQNAIEALETLTGTQGTNISALQTAVAELQAIMNTANGKIAAAENRIAALEDKVSALETAKQNLDAAVAALNAAINNKADTATLNQKVTDLIAAIAAAEDAAKTYADGKDTALQTQLTAAIATAKGEAITAAENLVNTAKAELQTAINNKADIVTLNAKVAELNAAIATAEATAKAYTDSAVTTLNAAIITAKDEAVDAAKDLVDAAKAELQAAIDNKADTATVNAAIANLQNAITALENAKDNYVSADAALKAELEAAIAKAKQEAIDAAKGHIPYIGTNGNWWIGDTDTGVDANGIKGDTGNGIASITTKKENGVTTVTITFTDPEKEPVVFTISDGETGATGADGVGVTKVEKTATNGNVDTYTITLTNGKTYTFTVTNGKDGADGKDGTDGKDGENGKDGLTPFIGENGNWWIGDTDTGVKAVADDSVPVGSGNVTEAEGVNTVTVVAIVIAGVALLSNVLLAVLVLKKKKSLV